MTDTDDSLPPTGTSPAVHVTSIGFRSSGGVTSSCAGAAARAPLICGLENDRPAHALRPGVSVTVRGDSGARSGSGPSCLPDASTKAAPG